MNLLDRYLLSHLQYNRLTVPVRLLYALRRPWLRWHVTETGRVVRVDVPVDEGLKQARRRAYADRTGR